MKHFTDTLLEEFDFLIEDIAAVKRQYSYIPENDFNKIIRLDPTFKENSNSVGKYGKWLLGLYKKDNPLNFDLANLKGLISEYDSIKNDRAKVIEKDIGKFKTIQDMFNAIKNTTDAELTDRQKLRQRRADANYDIVFENDSWIVYIPNTWEAAVNLGSGTSWCTSDSRPEYGKKYFDQYLAKGGSYYILINKDTDEKYQFQFESGQFMDEDDEAINISKFFDDAPELITFFESEGKNIDKLVINPFDLITEHFDSERLTAKLCWQELTALWKVLFDDEYLEDLLVYGEAIDLLNGEYNESEILDIFSQELEALFTGHVSFHFNPKVLMEAEKEAVVDYQSILEIFKEVFVNDIIYGLDCSYVNNHLPLHFNMATDMDTTIDIRREDLAYVVASVIDENPQIHFTDFYSLVENLKYEFILNADNTISQMRAEDFLIGYYGLREINPARMRTFSMDEVFHDYFIDNEANIKTAFAEAVDKHWKVKDLVVFE